MNEALPAVVFSILVVAALVTGYLIGYGQGHESENTAQEKAEQPPAHQPDSAHYKRGA